MTPTQHAVRSVETHGGGTGASPRVLLYTEYDRVPSATEFSTETWRLFEHDTWLSSLGRVCNKRRHVFYPKRPTITVAGRIYRLSRLIARVFELPRADGETEVWHRDGDKSNFRVDNLVWMRGRRGLMKAVQARPIGEEQWVLFDSGKDAARACNVSKTKIAACCRGIRKHTGGYEFRFAKASKGCVCREGEEQPGFGVSGDLSTEGEQAVAEVGPDVGPEAGPETGLGAVELRMDDAVLNELLSTLSDPTGESCPQTGLVGL